ncbi:MAG: response regulator transcription factor [Chloroflexi bacterium]|nr:response regulator transcription factor [Chloroflexota bacterium]
MKNAPIRILVADDHPVVRDGLIAMLSTQPDFHVVGEADTGLVALQKAISLQPDVILLDLEMPELDGAEVIRRLGTSNPTVRAIVFTAFDTDERILGAVQAGAQGYLLKGAPRDEIFRAIRVLREGGSLLQPIVASKLLRQVSGRGNVTGGLGGPAPEALTAREMEVLHLLAQGKTNREIAADLVVTERTVKFHVGSILHKLGAGNRTEAVAIAVQQELISL